MKFTDHNRRLVGWAQALLLAALMWLQIPVLAQSPSPAAQSPEQQVLIAAGQRIYREGISSVGQPIEAMGAAQMQVKGQAAACINCHQRSGYGTAEAQATVRPIVGPALFNEQEMVLRAPRIKAQLGTRQRPAYDAALLARVIRTGLDSAGKTLDVLMPRYPMAEADLRAVAAYLAALSVAPAPGVSDQEIHFATVIQPEVSAVQRKAVLDVMQAFFKDKSSNVRSDEQRREAGTMRMARAHRRWVLHVWELKGSADTWTAQLEAYYQARPVFALVGGLGQADWREIHEFSEHHEIPALFAQTPSPVTQGENHYNLYLTRGLMLEADVLGRYVQETLPAGKLLQVYRVGTPAASAAAALRTAAPAESLLPDMQLEGQADAAFWAKVAVAQPQSLVLWLSAEDLAEIPASLTGLPLYLSFAVLNASLPRPLVTKASTLRMVYPSDLSPKHESRLLRNKIWLHNKGILLSDEVLQTNTLFALSVLNDALGHIMDSFSRDYLVERAQHIVAQTPMPSFYPGVSLGPNQNFAAKGAAVVQWVTGDKPQLKALSAWIVP